MYISASEKCYCVGKCDLEMIYYDPSLEPHEGLFIEDLLSETPYWLDGNLIII